MCCSGCWPVRLCRTPVKPVLVQPRNMPLLRHGMTHLHVGVHPVPHAHRCTPGRSVSQHELPRPLHRHCGRLTRTRRSDGATHGRASQILQGAWHASPPFPPSLLTWPLLLLLRAETEATQQGHVHPQRACCTVGATPQKLVFSKQCHAVRKPVQRCLPFSSCSWRYESCVLGTAYSPWRHHHGVGVHGCVCSAAVPPDKWPGGTILSPANHNRGTWGGHEIEACPHTV